MTPDDTGEGEDASESVLSRRELLGASAALGTAAIASATPGVGSVAAQSSTEPRIALGADYNVYDDPNGNGDLVIKHEPSGNTFTYNATTGEWTAGKLKANSVITDDIDIGAADLLTTGDFVPFTNYDSYQESWSTTSTSYVTNNSFFQKQVQWGHHPSATDSVLSSMIIDGRNEPTDVRLRNATDGETIFEILNVTTQDPISRIDGYVPTTTGSPLFIRPELRADDGSASAVLKELSVALGVQL